MLHTSIYPMSHRLAVQRSYLLALAQIDLQQLVRAFFEAQRGRDHQVDLVGKRGNRDTVRRRLVVSWSVWSSMRTSRDGIRDEE